MEKLKPCPFCGGGAQLADALLSGIPVVTCDRCGATVYDSPAEVLSAVAAWNRRASDAALAKAREAAREALEEARGGLMNKYVADKIAAALAALKEVE